MWLQKDHMQNICIWHIVHRTNSIGLNILSLEARKKLDRMNDWKRESYAVFAIKIWVKSWRNHRCYTQLHSSERLQCQLEMLINSTQRIVVYFSKECERWFKHISRKWAVYASLFQKALICKAIWKQRYFYYLKFPSSPL